MNLADDASIYLTKIGGIGFSGHSAHYLKRSVIEPDTQAVITGFKVCCFFCAQGLSKSGLRWAVERGSANVHFDQVGCRFACELTDAGITT